jgi:murein DD-endopeptidase MepM/ murein hydrolase activator NlpD
VHGPLLETFSFDQAHPYTAGQHRGIAIGADNGAPVLAPAGGVVSFAGTVASNGKTVTIETPAGLAVSLTHLGSLGVKKDDAIAEGDEIGTAGASGTVEFDVPYVHLGIRDAGNPQGYLDPLSFLPVAVPPVAPPPPSPPPAELPAPAPPAATPAPVAPPVSAPTPAPVEGLYRSRRRLGSSSRPRRRSSRRPLRRRLYRKRPPPRRLRPSSRCPSRSLRPLRPGRRPGRRLPARSSSCVGRRPCRPAAVREMSLRRSRSSPCARRFRSCRR